MKAKNLLFFASSLLCVLAFSSCNDDVSPIGGSLANGEVTIKVDSLVTSLSAECYEYDKFDGRNSTKLLGRINVPEYGRLSCSFVSQMMAATQLPSALDTITTEDVDSMKLVLSIPRGALTGDSLTPQQLRVYRLTDQLPADITSTYDPAGHFDPTPLGSKSYTVTNITKSDSVQKNSAYVRIPVDLPVELAREIFEKYRTQPEIFQWPATFNAYFPGIYVEQNFGNGCIANISRAQMFTYWKKTRMVSEMQPDSTYKNVPRVFRDSSCLMASQPEVLSSNIIDYEVSDVLKSMVANGRNIITTPGGYLVKIKFPVLDLLEEFRRNGKALAIVSSLRFQLPARAVTNSYDLQAAPSLLMIKKTEYEDFFKNNKVPDNRTSFVASYDSENQCYRFNAMRSWFVQLIEDQDNGETIDEDDYEFVLVPVNTITEDVTDYNGNTTSYVTRCQPYLLAPTMTEILTDRAVITFTYSTQQLQ